ncbi:hypothetical protein BVX94_00975 [bacterium B17]|nr:hypothetical protein BVX94_00975 [bacterium B17]
MKNGSGIVVGLVEYMRNVAGTRITIAKRFKEACEAGMTSEAKALLQYLITERELITQAADSLRAQRVKTSSIVVPKLPASVSQLFATIDGVYNKAEKLFTECEEQELYASDVPKVARNMATAYYLDRASIKAKVGMGYATIANHYHLFVKPEKLSLKIPEASAGAKVVSEGAAMGLGGKGAVKLGVGAYNNMSGLGVDKQYAYWTLLPFHDLTAEVELPEVGISRASAKNPLNIISGRQSYKWLLVDHEAKVKSKGLLMSLKSGSGEGATDCFALPVSMAALSLYDKKKYRDDVLCAGGIEPDGTLLRIRGTAAKVRSVADSGKLKLMIIPAANKSDLAVLSVDDLCKCIIVLAEDINEAMGCATKMDYKEAVLATLVEAQDLIMGGSLYEAKKKLITIGNHSQIYNIGRLLELLTIADL